MPVVRACTAGADYRLPEEDEFVDPHEELDDGCEELPWEAEPYESPRRRGRAHVASALVAGIVVFVALTLHALDAGRPPGGIVAGGESSPRVRTTHAAGSPIRTSRMVPVRTREDRSRTARVDRRRRAHLAFAASSDTGGQPPSRLTPAASNSGRSSAGGEFGFER